MEVPLVLEIFDQLKLWPHFIEMVALAEKLREHHSYYNSSSGVTCTKFHSNPVVIKTFKTKATKVNLMLGLKEKSVVHQSLSDTFLGTVWFCIKWCVNPSSSLHLEIFYRVKKKTLTLQMALQEVSPKSADVILWGPCNVCLFRISCQFWDFSIILQTVEKLMLLWTFTNFELHADRQITPFSETRLS